MDPRYGTAERGCLGAVETQATTPPHLGALAHVGVGEAGARLPMPQPDGQLQHVCALHAAKDTLQVSTHLPVFF